MTRGSDDRVRIEPNGRTVVIGFFCGTLAGALFGSMLTATPMMTNLGGLFGEGPNVGWAIHLMASGLFGVGYAAVVAVGPFERYSGSVLTGTLLAAVYAIALWLVGGSLVVPAVFGGSVAYEIDGLSFLGHLVYGGLLGASFATALHASVPVLPRSDGA
jgi:hypothetical protein